MNRGPGWTGRRCCHCRSSQVPETWQTPELLTSPTEAPHSNFSFINSGCWWHERGVAERRRKGHAAGTEHGESVAYSCNYPALLVMIIILLREWNVFAPQPRLHFRAWVDELIKTFHWLARWVACDIQFLARLASPGDWLARSLTK